MTTPPTIGAAIRLMTSAPVPWDHSTGTTPAKMVASVVAFGRMRFMAASARIPRRASSLAYDAAVREALRSMTASINESFDAEMSFIAVRAGKATRAPERAGSRDKRSSECSLSGRSSAHMRAAPTS